MFAYIYEWIRNLAYYMILVTAVLQVAPEGGYRKYIRFFCGLLLVVLLASPVLSLLGAKTDFAQVLRSARYEETVQKMEDARDRLEELAGEAQEGGGAE